MIAGQSNALSYVGNERLNDLTILRHSPSGKVSLNKPLHSRDEFFIPTKENPTEYSIGWLYCAEEIVRTRKRPVVIINMAKGSTKTAYWADQYLPEFLESVAKYKPDMILWHQGEADDKYGVSQEVSYLNLKKVIQATRQVLPDIPWVIAINSQRVPTQNAPVRTSQRRLIEEGLGFEGPDTDVLRMDPSNMDQENLHFVGKGAKEFGLAWYKSIKRANLL